MFQVFYLRIQVVTVSIGEPQERVVAVGQRVGSDPRDVMSLLALPSTMSACHDARYLSRRAQIVLDPLVS